MKFKFKIQQYQTDAVEQTVNVFAGQPSKTNAQYRRDLGKRKEQITFEEEYVGWRNSDVEVTVSQSYTNENGGKVGGKDGGDVPSLSLVLSPVLSPARAKCS